MLYIIQAVLLASSIIGAQAVAVTGASTGIQNNIGPNGSIPSRRNILTLQNDGPAWDLYIQGLIAMKAAVENDTVGFFQIAGIHGRPYTAWDGVGGVSTTGWSGYCTHDSILFPIWHRPYLALFEEIAAEYTGYSASIYQNAANELRIPYWDWATNSAMPDILNTPTVSINTPFGQETLNNPLYSYLFPPLNGTQFPVADPNDGFLANDSTTLRNPDSNGTSQPTLANQDLEAQPFQAMTINSGSSLEAVHGIVHSLVGGDNHGHMYQLSYSGFDPIFFLHHANVDRLFALWQAVYPSAWFPSDGNENPYGTFTIQPGSVDYSTSSLTPFYSIDQTTFYTSDTARNVSTFGYTYPEIQDWSQSPEQLAANVTKQINTLYNPTSATSRIKRAAMSTRDWTVAVSVDKFALLASFTIKVFIGAPPTDPKTWSRASNLAGLVAVMVPHDGNMITGVMSTHGEVLLDKLLSQAGLPDMEVSNVVPYLKQNLQWRVQKADGSVVDNLLVPSLALMVQDQVVSPAKDLESFPTRGKVTSHPDVTAGT